MLLLLVEEEDEDEVPPPPPESIPGQYLVWRGAKRATCTMQSTVPTNWPHMATVASDHPAPALSAYSCCLCRSMATISVIRGFISMHSPLVRHQCSPDSATLACMTSWLEGACVSSCDLGLIFGKSIIGEEEEVGEAEE